MDIIDFKSQTGTVPGIIHSILNGWATQIEDNTDNTSDSIGPISEKFKQILENKLKGILLNTSVNHIQPEESSELQVSLFPASLICSNSDNSGKEYHGVSFDDKIFINVTFIHSKFHNCRFRNCKFLFCDCRYIEVNGGTFEGCNFWWCDLYRASFQGLVRFFRAEIEMSSLNNAYFGSGVLLRRENLKDGVLLQEHPENYRMFLLLWDAIRCESDKMKNDRFTTTSQRLNDNFNHRHHELELIYKSLSSSFASNGFSHDSNWAYVKSKRAERKVLKKDFKWEKQNFRNITDVCINYIYDGLFGYGESLLKIFTTYLFTVLLFTFIFKYGADVPDFFHAFTISLGNMVGIHSSEVSDKNDIFLNMLNLIQSTFGILLTGIFGFILGNKIRNQ